MHTIIDKRSGCVFEGRTYRVPGRKYPKSERKCIGKMVDGTFRPNSYFIERTKKEDLEKELAKARAALEEEEKVSEVEAAASEKAGRIVQGCVSSRRKEGATYAIGEIAKKSGIGASLEGAFGKEKAGRILSVASYFLITECEPVDDFCYFHETHAHSHGQDISSADFSRFFSSISEEEVKSFFRRLCGLGGGIAALILLKGATFHHALLDTQQ